MLFLDLLSCCGSLMIICVRTPLSISHLGFVFLNYFYMHVSLKESQVWNTLRETLVFAVSEKKIVSVIILAKLSSIIFLWITLVSLWIYLVLVHLFFRLDELYLLGIISRYLLFHPKFWFVPVAKCGLIHLEVRL